MKSEILLRFQSEKYKDVAYIIKDMIEDTMQIPANIIDHTHIDLNDFINPIDADEILVSIDRHIAKRLKIPYHRISRIFNKYGDVVGRYEEGISPFYGSLSICILDSDIVTGDTIQYVLDKFQAVRCSYLLEVNDDQDLIDMEDLFTENSLMVQDQNDIMSFCLDDLLKVSYLHNEEFFCQRTSLIKELYKPICELKNNF